MLNIYTSGEGTLKSSLAVFDGVELTVDGAGQASETINASAFKGWMDSNVYQSIADGFSQLSEIVTQDMIDAMPQQTREQVRRALRVDPKDKRKLTPRMFKERQRQLEIYAEQSQARKRAMARMATSTDHMAGMKRAHHRPGETTATNTPFAYEEIAEKLNQLAREEQQKIRQEGQDAQAEPAIQGPTSNLSEAVESIGELMPGGVRKVDGETLLTFLARDKDASPEQREIAQDLLSKPTGGKRGTFYFGETDALADIEEATIGVAGPTISLGRSYPTPGLAFIANTSPETVLHEMLHIQTTKALEAYVAEDGTAPRHVQEAGRNIERLMQQMRDTPPTDESAEAWGDALAAMNGAPDRIGQMGEFVSWMLSNQRLIERGQQRKAQTKRTPLARIVEGGWNALMKMLGLRSKPGNTVFTNLRFNTEVLTANAAAIRESAVAANRYMSQQSAGDTRLEWAESQFGNKLQEIVGRQTATTDRVERQKAVQESVERNRAGDLAISQAGQAGIEMNERQATVFKMIHTVMTSGVRLDASLMRQANDQYGLVLETLTAEELVAQGLTQSQAERRLAFLSDVKARTGRDGRTDAMATFMALSQVDPKLRAALEAKKPLRKTEVKADSIDGVLRNLAQAAVELLRRLSLRQTRDSNVTRELDIVAEGLAQVQKERRYMSAVNAVSERVEQANRYAAEQLETRSTRATDALGQRAIRADRKGQRAKKEVFKAGALITALGSKDQTAAAAEGLTKMANHVPNLHTWRAMLTDLRGQTDTNKGLLRMINPVKAQADAARQDFREGVPRELENQFSRELAREEWEALYAGIARTDLTSIGRDEAEALMSDIKIQQSEKAELAAKQDLDVI